MTKVLKDGRALTFDPESRPNNREDWLLICRLGQLMANYPRASSEEANNYEYFRAGDISTRDPCGLGRERVAAKCLKLGSLVMLR